MAKVIKPLKEVSIYNSNKTIFLAGTIDNGNASDDWQPKACEALKDYDVNIYNPRRDKWEGSWEQSIKNKDLVNQVEWELHALKKSDFILMNILGDSKSPITLLELGLHAQSGKLMVACPKDFYRYVNIYVTCKKYNVPLFETFDELLKSFISKNLNKK